MCTIPDQNSDHGGNLCLKLWMTKEGEETNNVDILEGQDENKFIGTADTTEVLH